MRPLWKDILVAVWLGMIIPGIVLNAFVLKQRHKNIISKTIETTFVENHRSILLHGSDGKDVNLPLNTYLTGVLLAEMPATFHPEALKAQAVAARTYTWKAFTTGGKHADGSICTDSTCCQGYLSEEDYLNCGGNQEHLQKIRTAVEATSDMVISYDGELIEATYYASSGGRTEAAVEVWGADYPYLQVVLSPETEDTEVAVSFSIEEFTGKLGLPMSADLTHLFGETTYTQGGGVDTMEICGEIFTGTQLRKLLGLRSTVFRMEMKNQRILVTTNGYGHRVGMSQYGANDMAEQGSTWQQILQHYYPGTVLHPIP